MISRAHIMGLAFLRLLLAGPAFAQTTDDQNTFDFSLPGARSRALGGAFVAIADDATSVYSNPGGLTQLLRPEVSVEGRYWGLTSQAIDHGHGFGRATGTGVDTIEGFVDKNFRSDVAGLSFLSFVYPGDRWAVGVFRHQLARYRMDRQIQGPFFDCRGGFRERGPDGTDISKEPFCEPQAAADGVDREFPKVQSFDLDIHSLGTAFAYDWSDNLSAGIAVQYFSFSLASTNRVFAARGEQKYQSPNFAYPQNLELISTQSGDDHAWAINAGLLWDVSPQWTIGTSFRQGPKFTFSTSLFLGPAQAPEPPVPDNPFNVPDTFSIGVLHRFTNFWRISFEYDKTNFHQLIDDFQDTTGDQNSEEFKVLKRSVRLNSANQFRVGSEYLVLTPSSRVFALRGGAWYDPSHQAYLDANEATGLPAPRWAVLLPKRDGTWHVSGGIGFTARRHLQIDAAADFSELIDTVSISSVWRF